MNSDPHYPSGVPTNSKNEKQSIHPQQWPNLLNRQRRWVKYSLIGAVGLAVATGGAMSYRVVVDSPAENVPDRRAVPVDTTEIVRVSSYEVPRIYTGEIAALRNSELGFERGGELVQVMVDEGQRVLTGDTVARLDVRNLQTQRLQVEAQKAQAVAQLTELQNGARAEDLAEAEAAVRDLEKQLTLQETQERRREYLYERGAIAREQLDEFAFGSDSLQAKLDQARSRLEELRNGTRFEQLDAQQAVVNQLDAQLQDIDVNISKSKIVAPFDGIVAERRADEGTVVGTGQPVVELVEAAAPEARIGIPADVVNQIQMGSRQSVTVDNQRYPAEVTAILPQVDSSTRTQRVVLALDDTAIGAIEPGQTARLTINETVQAEGFWLPRGALTQGIRGLWTCYVVVPADAQEDAFVVEQRSVEIIRQETFGDSSSGDVSEANTRVFVRGTLQPGEKIVTSGIHRLVPGQSVTALSPD
ncbi:MAG: efflux RND transporter periplasmic adaptor subunit [Cyanobacteria bacterium J06614_10]